MPVALRRERFAAPAWSTWSTPWKRLLERPVVADTGGPASDTAGVVGVVSGLQQRVELVDRVHHRHGHAVVAPEPAALTFHTALLVAALMPGLAVPGFKTVVRAKRNPALVLLPGAPEQHLFDRAVEVVVADLVNRHPAQPFEPIHVSFEERFLALGQKHPMRRARRL